MKKEKTKKTIFTRILEILIIVSLAVALFLGGKFLYSLYKQGDNAQIALAQADNIALKKPLPKKINSGTIIGKMKVEGLTDWLPILEGDDPVNALDHGVGHIIGTPLPGKNQGQPALSAHRETFFRPLKDAKNGDIVTVTMPYGTYKYKITHHIVTTPDQGAKIYSTKGMTKERIILITCYPFSFISPPDERIVFYADLVN